MSLTEQVVGPANHELSVVLDTLVQDYQRPIGRIVLATMPPEIFHGSAVPLAWHNYGAGTPLYDLRMATSVRDLAIDEIPGHTPAWELTDADRHVVFSRQVDAAGTDWGIVVVGHAGEVRFAEEYRKGLMTKDGYIGEGVRSKILSPFIGEAIVANMYKAASVIFDDDLLNSPNSHYRGLARDMWAHSLPPESVDQQR